MQRIVTEIPRHTRKIALDILDYSPMLLLQGARQVGKSTLLRQVMSSDTLFSTLDDDATRSFAESDPRGFVDQAPDKLFVIDEVQRVPQLALALKASIDSYRKPGRFAVTGSTNLLYTQGISDSLAGRTEILEVSTLSQGEILRREDPEDWVSWILGGCQGGLNLELTAEFHKTASHEHNDHPNSQSSDSTTIRDYVLAGGYPEPLKRPILQANRWFRSYLNQLATHDARELSGESSYPLHLERILRIVASQGQTELVKAKMAREIGISETALGDYLQLAKTMYLLNELPSWGIGFSGRVIRRPKISIADSGFAAYLSGLTTQKSQHVGGFELFGSTLEGFVANELRKQQAWTQQEFQLFHYRNRNEEADIVIELPDSRVILIEVKSALSVTAQAWKHLDTIMEKLGDRVAASAVLYLGNQHISINRPHGKIFLTPVHSLWTHT